MDYIEITLSDFSDFDPEIAIAQLAELGFESFTESESGLQAYIGEAHYQEPLVADYLARLSADHGLRAGIRKIEAQNWNALWESAYEPVTVAGKCMVRAPFHQAVNGITYDIVIEPRMSFGTAHHETTSLMLEFVMEEAVAGKHVLDMGCGTGVLAILAHKMGAARVVAIDTDDWAYSNALDNMEKNHAGGVEVIQGDSAAIPLPAYDIIIANINRNVLLADIPVYAGFMKPGSVLLLSGFYEEDLGLIRDVAETSGLKYCAHRAARNWTGAKFSK